MDDLNMKVFRSSQCRNALVTSVAVLISALAAVADGATVLRRASANEPRSLDPQYAIGNTAGALMYDMFEGLITVDEFGQLVPAAASSWTVSDDGLTYTFAIRDGLRWSDGTPLTAADFEYSLKRIVDPKNALRGAGTIFPITNAVAISQGEVPAAELGVRALDPLTLEITLESPAPFFIDMLAGFPAAAVPRQSIEAHGAQWTTPGKMVVSGAYVLDEWVSNTHYKLVRNPYFREADTVQIDEVFYYPVTDKESAVKRFRAGELDIILDVPPNRMEWAQENLPDELKISSAPGIRYLIINNAQPNLRDVRVRKALSISINREIITSKILRDGSIPVTNFVPAALAGYGPNPAPYADEPYPQRVEEAKRLIADAGYGEDNPLEIRLSFLPQENFRRVVVALQAMWRSIGVTAKLQTIGKQGRPKMHASGDFDLSVFTYYAPFSDPTAFLLLLESNSFRNYSRYSNPTFDAMVAESSQLTDETERMTFLKQTEQFALSEFALIPLFNPGRTFLVSRRIQGWHDHSEPHLARYLSVPE